MGQNVANLGGPTVEKEGRMRLKAQKEKSQRQAAQNTRRVGNMWIYIYVKYI